MGTVQETPAPERSQVIILSKYSVLTDLSRSFLR